MELSETRSSAKTGKKGGGKPSKTLSAEEVARRREALKERLELDRRALQVVDRLLEDRVSEDFLTDSAKLITSANYKDAVEERFISKLCGYPICSNKLIKIPTQQYKISTKTNRVYDITERKRFCSNFCYKASKEFELQISKTPLWLRQHESPPEIRLLKNGDGGSSGEEVILTERRVKEDDVENLPATLAENLHGSLQISTGGDGSSGEQEQDFVSSVVSHQDKPHVHWGDLPERSDQHDKVEQRKTRSREGPKEETEHCQIHGTEEENVQRVENKGKDLVFNAPQAVQEERDQRVEGATAKTNECSLSERVAVTETEDKAPFTGSKHDPATTPTATSQKSRSPAGLSFSQEVMSRRGAAGLRDLLQKPDSVPLNLLESLRRTLKEWCTEETFKFLYGDDHSPVSSSVDLKEEKEEEELDEDDLNDEVTVTVAAELKRPSAPAPDYEKLRRQTQQMELRVREFYKGTWVLPEEEEELKRNQQQGTVQDQILKNPALPLVDSHAQHLIQKRIVVEKLNSCLRSIVGPLGLTLSEVSTDLNHLVRTFRFTNTNIIHRTTEWTLLAVVLLHLLSEVSPAVLEALETSASVQYLKTLMEELSLQEQDLLRLVQMFKRPTHSHQ